jgi:hypothetical protein
MANIDIQDTAAYKIIRQVVNHTWGSEEDLNDDDVIAVSRDFHANGGSWERLMDGDASSVTILENAIDDLINNRRLAKIAHKIAQ